MLTTYICWTLQNAGKRNEIHIESFMPMQKYLYIFVYMNDARTCVYVKEMEIYIFIQMHIYICIGRYIGIDTYIYIYIYIYLFVLVVLFYVNT